MKRGTYYSALAVFMAGIAFFTSGCSKKNNPVAPSFSIDGTWLGVITTQQTPDTYSFDLLENLNGQVYGTGTVDGGGALKVTGTCTYPDVGFTVSGTWPDKSQYASTFFNGKVTDNNHMVGSFGYDQMALTRQ